MPAAGRKPKANKVTRHRMVHDWVEVEDVAFSGPVPVELPTTREVMTQFGPEEVDVTDAARAWWADVCRMPHCVLWSQTDWRFALATALVADIASKGTIGANAELRQRERILGLTGDARRDLRIRYVPAGSIPAEKKPRASKAETAKADASAERRLRLVDAS